MSKIQLTDADVVLVALISTCMSMIVTIVIVIATVEVKVLPHIRNLNERVEKLEGKR